MDDYTLEQGDPEEQTILFLPAANMTRHSWRPHMDDLAEEFHMVAVDLPGHGHHPSPTFDFKEAIRTVLSVLEATGPAILVGYSLGGYVAAHTARNAPDHIDGIVLMGAAHNWNAIHMRLLGTVYELFLPRVVALVRSSEWSAARARAFIESDDLDERQRPDDPETVHDSLRTMQSIFSEALSFRRTWESLDEYDGPLLIIHGAEEFNRGHATQLADRRANARVAFIQDADHQGLGTAWDPVTEQIRQFAHDVAE